MDDLFDTHKFLFTLSYENRYEDHSIEYLNKENETEIIKIKELIVNTSPVSCRVIDENGNKKAIGYLRVIKIFDEDNEVVWDMSDRDISDVKIIGGY